MRRIVSFLGSMGVLLLTGQAGTLAQTPGRDTFHKQLDLNFSSAEVRLTPDESFTRVELVDGMIPADPEGSPCLPARLVHVHLPRGAEGVTVDARVETRVLATGLRVSPVQPSVPASGTIRPLRVPPDPAAYAATSPIPATWAQTLQTQTIRGHTIVTLRLNPVRWRPGDGALVLAERMRVTITGRLEKSGRAPARALARTEPATRRGLLPLLANPADVESDSATPEYPDVAAPVIPTVAEPVGSDYLLITRQSLAEAFQPLLTHRQSQELSTALVTVETIDATYPGYDLQEKIRRCIQDYTTNSGTRYVVLGGDDTIVPDRDTTVSASGYSVTNAPTDLYYSALDGTWDSNGNHRYGEAGLDTDVDLAPDVLVGRLPVRTATHASNYVAKLIRWETEATEPQVRRMLVGGNLLYGSFTGASRPAEFQDHDPVSDAEVWARRLFSERVASSWVPASTGMLFDTLSTWDSTTAGDYTFSSANLATRLNQGWYQVFLATHGNVTIWGMESGGTYSSTAAGALINSNAPSIVYTIACLTGGFDMGDPSLSEAFLRNARGGALAFIGSSRYGWVLPGSWEGGPSFELAREFYRLALSPTNLVTLGDAFAMSKAAFAAGATANNAYRWLQFCLNLQGDPAMWIERDNPLRHRTFTVTVTNSANGIVNPPGPVRVAYGGSAAFDIVAEPYHHVQSVICSGSATPLPSAAAVTNWVWTGITNNGTLHVIFAENLTTQGTPEAWLAAYGMEDPAGDDLADRDGDGLATWAEYVAGTDPTNAQSALLLLGVDVAGGTHRVTWLGSTVGPASAYAIDRCDDLAGNRWTNVAEGLPRLNGTNTWSGSAPAGSTPVLYRIRVQ